MNNLQSGRPDRRRTPRIALNGTAHAGIMAAGSVRIIDISIGGVLLDSGRAAPVGTRGRLSLTVGGSPLAAEVEIRRVVETPDHTGFRIGAMFIGITPAQQDAIQRFARQ